jgi:hypothetical protein
MPDAHEILEIAQLSKAAQDVLAERRRQIEVEGYTPEHDQNAYGWCELAEAGAAYALATLPSPIATGFAAKVWPFDPQYFKPRGNRANLVRAAALILAQIELDDAIAKGQRSSDGFPACVPC